MIINYTILEILNESDSVADFKRGLIVKDVEFKAKSVYSNSPSSIKLTIGLNDWKEAKKTMSITL